MALSIGGERFETTKSTLSGSTFFAAMLDSEERGLPVPKDGVWRVDRAAQPTFPLILAFLRDGLDNLTWPDKVLEDDELLRAIQAEACYYGINALENFVTQLLVINGSFGLIKCSSISYRKWLAHINEDFAVGMSEEMVEKHFPSLHTLACKAPHFKVGPQTFRRPIDSNQHQTWGNCASGKTVWPLESGGAAIRWEGFKYWGCSVLSVWDRPDSERLLDCVRGAVFLFTQLFGTSRVPFQGPSRISSYLGCPYPLSRAFREVKAKFDACEAFRVACVEGPWEIIEN